MKKKYFFLFIKKRKHTLYFIQNKVFKDITIYKQYKKMSDTEQLKIYVIRVLKEENKNIDEKLIDEFMFSINSNEHFSINIEKLSELKVDYSKKHSKQRLLNSFEENVDFSRTYAKSTGGRPSEIIMLTAECFKSLCITAQNEFGKKTRDYYITIERVLKKYMKESLKQLEEANKNLNDKLIEEQKDIVKMKKYICTNTLKNHHRHQFPVKPCIYILKNPDEVYDKFKYGFSTNINERLSSDRTMIPNLKVKFILYTEHCELFEKIINIKYKDRLMLPAHEWIFDNIENIIKNIKDINRVCGFNGIEETELWRYNMEDPSDINNYQNDKINEKEDTLENRFIKTTSSHEDIEKDVKELSYKKSNGILTDRLHRILPCYLTRVDYLQKNKDAPDGYRYCNGFCQKYKLIDTFLTINTTHNTICEICKNMELVAKIKITKGLLTADQIRSNPSILVLNDNERVCKKCEIIKDTNEFEKNRVICKKCRINDSKNKILNYCENEMKNDIKILYNIRNNLYELKLKLNNISKDNLIKIIKHLKIGRKSIDTKEIMINNTMEYFKNVKVETLDKFINLYFS